MATPDVAHGTTDLDKLKLLADCLTVLLGNNNFIVLRNKDVAQQDGSKVRVKLIEIRGTNDIYTVVVVQTAEGEVVWYARNWIYNELQHTMGIHLPIPGKELIIPSKQYRGGIVPPPIRLG